MSNQYGDNQFGKTSQLSLSAVFRDGKTVLEDVFFTAPYKVMTPFIKENGGIQIMPLCASAGIMKGDVQKINYNIGKGANLEILSQAFEKIHRMDGGCARREIKVNVGKNAILSYYPQPVIPFADSAFDSNMEILLEDFTSKLFLMDIISCGRSACGERFEYKRFSSKIRIFRGGKLIYNDNTRYEPERMSMEGIGVYEGYSHLANVFLSVVVDNYGTPDDRTMSDFQEKIYEIIESERDCDGGVTRLAQGDLAVRILGNRAQKLQEIAEKIKVLFL